MASRAPILPALSPALNEALPDLFRNLQQKWENEFPGPSASLQALRDSVIFAEITARRAKDTFWKFQLILEFTGAPMHHWHPKILRYFNSLQRAQAQSSRRFLAALRTLQIVHTQYQSQEKQSCTTTISIPPNPSWFTQESPVLVPRSENRLHPATPCGTDAVPLKR
jgi:hypothetical protein